MPSPNPSAVAVAEPQRSDLEIPVSKVVDTISKGGIEMIRAEIRIPVHHQYKIAAGGEMVDGRWVDKFRVGVTADGYDYINRFVGAQFLVPDFIHNEDGKQVRNPIHRRDYIYERMVAIWYNDLGQMQAYSEDLEVDFQVLYQKDRLNSVWYVDDQGKVWPNKGAKDLKRTKVTAMDDIRIKRNPDGTAVLGDDGGPVFDVVLPDSIEGKCLQRLYDLRSTGMRYAQTVLKNRLMKVITGVRMLPIEQPRPFSIAVMAYRDSLTPEKRMEKVIQDQQSIFGKALQKGATLSDEEIGELSLEQDTEIDPREVEAAKDVTPQAPGQASIEDIVAELDEEAGGQ